MMRKYICILAIGLSSCSDVVYNNDNLRSVVINNNGDAVADTALFRDKLTVKLETTDRSIIGEVAKVMLSDTTLYIEDYRQKKIAFFGLSGKFIGSIQSIGKGHGEYIELCDFTIDRSAKELLLLVYPYGIMHYTLDGKFKYKDELDKSYTDIACDDRCYYLRNETFPDRKQVGCSLTIVDKETKKKKELLELDNEYAPFCSFGQRIYDNGRIFFTRFFDSTVYELTDGKAVPAYSIDFGKYTFPEAKMKKQFDCSELFSMSEKGSYIYAMSKLKVGQRYMIFSSNLFDYNVFDTSTGDCTRYDKLKDIELDFHGPSYLPVNGTTDKVCVVLAATVFESTKNIVEQHPELRNKFSEKLIEMSQTSNKNDNPTLLIYSLK